MPPQSSPQTLALLRRQDDVVATWQLAPSETRAATRAARVGQWTRLTSRVLLAGVRRPDPRTLAIAAVLHCAPHAVLAGRNALVLHGWNGEFTRPFDVAVPENVQPQKAPAWCRVRRLRRPFESHVFPPRVPVHDAVVQACAWARSDREAALLVISALQQRLTTTKRVHAALSDTTPRRRLLRWLLGEFHEGIHSVNEYDFAPLCRRFGLPAPLRQITVRDAKGTPRSIDVEFGTAGGGILHVEVEGVHHVEPRNWLDDIERHNQLVLAGHDAYPRVASLTLRLDPAPFMTELRDALALPARGL